MSHCEDDAVHCETGSEVYIMRSYKKECDMLKCGYIIFVNDNYEIMRHRYNVLKQEDIYE